MASPLHIYNMDNQLKVKVSQQPISSKHLPMFITSVLIMLTINFTIKYVAHSDLSLVELLHTYMPFALGNSLIFSAIWVYVMSRTNVVEISPAEQLDMDKLLAQFTTNGYQFIRRRNNTIVLRKGYWWLGLNTRTITITTTDHVVTMELPASTFGEQYLSGDFSPAKLHK